MVPAPDLDIAAEQTAEVLSRINMPAHAATKLRARSSTIQAIRAAIDAEITLDGAEQKVASCNARA